VEYDTKTLQALSDHVLVKTKIHVQAFRDRDKQQGTGSSPETIYKWIDGSCIQDYATSA
jgi:hypothetical protein